MFLKFFGECFIRVWNSNYVDMHVDVEIQLFRHVDMEKTCRPQHYLLYIFVQGTLKQNAHYRFSSDEFKVWLKV